MRFRFQIYGTTASFEAVCRIDKGFDHISIVKSIQSMEENEYPPGLLK